MNSIEVQYTATLAEKIGVVKESYDSADCNRLDSLLQAMDVRHGDRLQGAVFATGQTLLPSVLIAINETQAEINPDRQIHSGDKVLFLSPISGG